MSRKTKSPRQRAEEALAVEERRVKRLSDKFDALVTQIEEVTLEREIATRRRDYLAAHPDLGDPAQMVIAIESGAKS